MRSAQVGGNNRLRRDTFFERRKRHEIYPKEIVLELVPMGSDDAQALPVTGDKAQLNADAKPEPPALMTLEVLA